MEIVSTQFTEADIGAFLADYYEHERRHLIARMRRIIEDTEALVSPLVANAESNGESWSGVETLAHMTVSAGFFGWLVHEIATKKQTEVDLLGMLKLRDVTGAEAAEQAPEALARQLRESIERTIRFLESVPYDDLRTSFKYVTQEMTAEDVIRIPLCSHLEEHIEQIRQTVGT